VIASGLPILALVAALAATQPAPETFDLTATATAASGAGSATVPLTVRIDRYPSDLALAQVTDGLKYNGYLGFVKALRAAPEVGVLEVAGQKFLIRYVRQIPRENGRTLTVITDKPVIFVGGGMPGAKSKAGYEVALLQFTVDAAGKGDGIMAAAARVKSGGAEGGVIIDNYAETPMKLAVSARAPK
jgi:hypothetical protein